MSSLAHLNIKTPNLIESIWANGKNLDRSHKWIRNLTLLVLRLYDHVLLPGKVQIELKIKLNQFEFVLKN